MKRQTLEKFSTPALVERFIQNCLGKEAAWADWDIPTLNRHADDNHAILKTLDCREPDGRLVLLPLLSNYNLTVRCTAAVCLITAAPERAVPILREFHASNVVPLNSDAGMALMHEGYRKAGDRPDGTRDPAIDRIIENARERDRQRAKEKK